MRKYLKYIFCVLVLAALIFQSFVLFYFANTYSINQKRTGIQFPNGAMECSTEPQNMPPTLLSVSSESLEEIPEPSETEIQDEYTPEEMTSDPPIGEPLVNPQQEPEPPTETEPKSLPQTQSKSTLSINPNNSAFYSDSDEILETETEEITSNFTQEEILLEILTTMKINQYIMIFVLSCAVFWLFFKPIVRMLR